MQGYKSGLKILCQRFTILFFLFILLLFPKISSAATINAKSCSASDVQAAINSASDGDTVQIPPCSLTSWASQVTIPNTKGIKLRGAGIGQTVISIDASNTFKFIINTASGNSPVMVSDMTFEGGASSGNALINITGNGMFRLHHLKFSNNNNRVLWIGDSFSQYYGPFGVIDNNTFTASALPSNVIWVENGSASWSTPMSFGTADAVYIEDNTFDYGNYSSGYGFFDGCCGGRAVLRYNTVKNADVKVHGYDSSPESFLQLEAYNNTIDCKDTVRHFFLRGGTGYIYNNTLIGGQKAFDLIVFRASTAGNSPCVCNGTCYVDGNQEANGYACHDQVGRGYNQTLVPYYEFNNTIDSSDADFYNSTPSHIKEGRDFYNDTQKPNYTPYTYPHPLIDLNAPTVQITSPTSSSTYTTTNTTINLSGNANDPGGTNIGIASVVWSNNATGGSSNCTVSGSGNSYNWDCGSISIASGQNTITVTATDGDGSTATDILLVNPSSGGGGGGDTPPPSSGGGDSSASGGGGCGFVKDDSNTESKSQSGRVADIGLMILLIIILAGKAIARRLSYKFNRNL